MVKPNPYRALSLAAGLVLSAGAASADTQRWLHIKVHEQNGDHACVSVNLPVTMIEKVAPLVESKSMHGHRLRIDDADFDGADLREIWRAMKEAGDGHYVTVDSDRDNVRVKKEGGFMFIQATDHGRRDERVDVKIPLTVVDALFSGEGDDLDVGAAMRALASAGEGEFVTATSEDATVRIWVDTKVEAE